MRRDTVDLIARLGQLRTFIGRAGLSRLGELEGQLRRQGIRRRKVESEIREIRDRIHSEPRVEIATIERSLEQKLSDLKAVERLIAEAEGKKRELTGALQRLQTEIRRLPTANRRLAVETEVVGALKGLFEAGIGDFRDRLRREVERNASEIHKHLTSEPSYAGLRINEQYGLQLVGESGRAIVDRSAGSEQIVALSLIAALNRCATREGPVVMDTPFGRLDRTHRRNVLTFAPEFGPQVVFLVQSGEYERDRDGQILAGRIAREYVIERVGASDRSRFVSL